MSPIVRPARADELQRVQELIVGSINDLTGRHGFGAMASVRPASFQLFSFDEDPGGFWVAENDGDLVGAAFSWSCGDLWFLAELFVSPTMQGSGLGRELLQRTLRHADRAGAKTRALITFAFNTVSLGLYLRHGLYPRLPLYMVGADRDALGTSASDAGVTATRIDASKGDIARLAALDESALGVSRARHHRFLLGEPTMSGYLFHEGGDCIGYGYVAATGQVGPLAVTRRDRMAMTFRRALTIAAESGASRVSAFIPGNCEAALGAAADNGLRIVFPMVLVSDREFGDWTRYLPRNPGFM
jgi:GNAT superfamily N-acetyltransferase